MHPISGVAARAPSSSTDGSPIVRLALWHRRFVLWTLVAIAASGTVWWVCMDLVTLEPGPLARTLAVVHGGASFVALVAFGSLLPLHVRLSWQARRNRQTGVLSIGVFALLGLTAFALYYGSEHLRGVAHGVHVAVGLAAIACLPFHIWSGRRLPALTPGGRSCSRL